MGWNNPLHVHIIHGAMPNVRDSIGLFLIYYVPCQKNKRPIGLSIYHHWCLPVMQHHIRLLDFNPTS